MEKTDLKVDKAVLHKTTDCIYDFTCLAGDKTCLCEVVDSNGEDIVEIKTKCSLPCKYCVSLESASYCTCPTRVEVYKRYNM
jgi:hypothetical protein